MAAKKHSKRTATDKTIKGRQTPDATSEAVPAEVPASAELAPVQAAESACIPTAETTRIDTPVPTEAEHNLPDPTVPNQPAPVKQFSALDAAVRVLEESGQAMTCTPDFPDDSLVSALRLRLFPGKPSFPTTRRGGTLQHNCVDVDSVPPQRARRCGTTPPQRRARGGAVGPVVAADRRAVSDSPRCLTISDSQLSLLPACR